MSRVWTFAAGALVTAALLVGCPREEQDKHVASFPERLAEEQAPPGYGGKVPEDADYPCMAKRVDGICNAASAFSLPQRDIKIDASLPPPSRDAEYPRLLSDALGFDAPRLGQADRGKSRPYGIGTITEIRARYQAPEIAMRALYAERPGASEVVVVVHGLGSSPDKVMGLDHEDYMRRIGQVLFERGRDVIAIEATTNAVLGTRANARLLFYGTTVYGLTTRTVCDLTVALRLRKRYERVIVYGLSSGAWVSLFAAVLCEPFALVIVDDGGGSWRHSLWQNPDKLQAGLKYGMFVRYIQPLYERTSIAGPLASARSPLVWINQRDAFEGWRDELDGMRFTRGVDAGRIRLVFKKRNMHIPEIHGLILPLLEGQTVEIDGYTLG